MEIVFASGNPHKIFEVNQIAKPFNVTFIKPESGFEPDECGETFEENALIKARTTADLGSVSSSEFFLADDSGLCVEFLQGRPGIHSARFAENSSLAIDKLLKEMENAPEGKRAASFVCSMALVNRNGEILHKTTGTVKGQIGFERAGDNGFGYDPVFVLADGRTMAQLSDDEKNLVSHRGKALVDMLVWIKMTQMIKRP